MNLKIGAEYRFTKDTFSTIKAGHVFKYHGAVLTSVANDYELSYNILKCFLEDGRIERANVPEESQKYYYISHLVGERRIQSTTFYKSSNISQRRVQQGNFFLDKDEAEEYLQKIIDMLNDR